MLEYYLSQGTAACSEPFATTVFPWRTRNIFHSLVPSESGRLNNFSWNLSGLGLGTGQATKTDDFLEKFQTAFGPPPRFSENYVVIIWQMYKKKTL